MRALKIPEEKGIFGNDLENLPFVCDLYRQVITFCWLLAVYSHGSLCGQPKCGLKGTEQDRSSVATIPTPGATDNFSDLGGTVVQTVREEIPITTLATLIWGSSTGKISSTNVWNADRLACHMTRAVTDATGIYWIDTRDTYEASSMCRKPCMHKQKK